MRMTVRALRHHGDAVLWAEIHAIEGQSYMVILQLGGGRAILSDNHNRALRFAHPGRANELLGRYRIEPRELVHHSPYNEMIGLDESAIHPLRLQTGRHA